jgi:hypothetical protein
VVVAQLPSTATTPDEDPIALALLVLISATLGLAAIVAVLPRWLAAR